MENEIVDSLEDVGYDGSLLELDAFNAAVEGGTGSIEFTKLIEWLTLELGDISLIEDHVRAINGPDDADNFLMELSGFLREYGCPYKDLSDGPVTQRLATTENRLRLLNYLVTELQAARMVAANKPHLIVKPVKADKSENPASLHLKLMLMALGFPKPPEGITPFALFSKVESKIKEILSKIELAHLSRPLLKARLSDKQWESIQYIDQALNLEYELRRKMLVQRLEVTIQSFLWSDKAKKSEEKFFALYNPVKGKLLNKVEIDLAYLLAAREDLLKIEKTSGGSAREKTKCNINRVVIGKVPDRGGRAYEHEPPPPEMPSFQQRQQPQPQRDGGGGGRGYGDGHGRGGDRVRGGWSDNRSGGGSGGSNWGQNQVSYGSSQQDNPAAGFFGGGGGGGAFYGQSDRGRGGGHRYHQDNGYQGGYQQGGHQQGGYQQGGYQQGGYQQGGYQQGGHHQGGHQQGYQQDGGYYDSHRQGGHQQGGQGGHYQGGHQQGGQGGYQGDSRGGGRGQGGGRGRGRGNRR